MPWLYLLQSVVDGDLYEFYIFDLYFEQILLDEDQMETRLRYHRTMATPLLSHPILTENRETLFKKYKIKNWTS